MLHAQLTQQWCVTHATQRQHISTHIHQTLQVRDEYSTSNDIYQPQAAQKGPGGTAGPVSSTAAAPSGTAAAGPSTAPPQSTTAKLIESMPEPADKCAFVLLSTPFAVYVVYKLTWCVLVHHIDMWSDFHSEHRLPTVSGALGAREAVLAAHQDL